MKDEPLFGYKMHLAVDQSSGLVRRAILTPAHVSDKAPFLALVQGDEQAVYADRGYDGWWYREELARRGIADGIMAGSYRRRPLTAEGHARNRALAALRRPIERTFGVLKTLVRLRPGALPVAAAQRVAAAAAGARLEPAPRARARRLRADCAPTMAA
jgi:IS5 family transposase